MKSLLSIALAASLLSPIKLMSEEQNYTFEDAITEALDYVRIRNNKLDDFLRENNSSSVLPVFLSIKVLAGYVSESKKYSLRLLNDPSSSENIILTVSKPVESGVKSSGAK